MTKGLNPEFAPGMNDKVCEIKKRGDGPRKGVIYWLVEFREPVKVYAWEAGGGYINNTSMSKMAMIAQHNLVPINDPDQSVTTDEEEVITA